MQGLAVASTLPGACGNCACNKIAIRGLQVGYGFFERAAQSHVNAGPLRLLGIQSLVGPSDHRLGRVIHLVLRHPPRESD